MDFPPFLGYYAFIMLEYNEITPKKFIVYQGEPYEVVESHVARTQQRKPQNQTKIRSLLSGKVIPATFHASDKVKEADIETKEIKYLYTNRGETWFCEADDPSKRFTLKEAVLEGKEKFLKPNAIATAVVFDETVIGIRIPIKVELLVKESAPAVRGNTVQGGTKQVVLETGATINVPMFINEGDVLRINTETGEYTERVDKR
ncbi:MAG: Elongation factor P [Parcubacteria group bacterium GW2011_GWA1_47_8]|nr:MAG: Elongation factor P [Parcubacteria group bacterium GW2011_GWA1_47_8]KKW07989.1 MAG: Elongation factor P [Parcubacteria group bacterium GW2011_GWA2_49_16]